ncbi:AAA family ATPase [Heyndrickxia sp. NPDC080065]|uniref:AAA family ATPase n=1 Tax=Heyndrickxia sp. NPDC080065 TaxID=3390568 RepID=UPI003D07B9BC
MFFLQMSGFPGSGKSTLARVIAKSTGAIIVDHDIVKSALLESIEESNIDSKVAGKISYNIDWSLIEFHLSQGYDVIFDSPCFYSEIFEKGSKLSKKYQAKYKYVECYLNDIQEINKRLKKRDRMPSQIHEVSSKNNFEIAIDNSKKPSDIKCLLVDSGQPLESYINDVKHYLNE